MHCKQWIFDMDGTLTDSMTVVWEGARCKPALYPIMILGQPKHRLSCGAADEL